MLKKSPTHFAEEPKKKGRRKTRHDLRQRYGCSSCGHTFVKERKHSSYPVKLVMEGISFYNLGYSARKTKNYLKRRFDIRPPEKTFRFWHVSHKPICTYYQIRDQIKKRCAPAKLIEKLYLKHHHVYLYQIHKGFLTFPRY